MQTQCPQCNTRFRVTDAQLNTAAGVVRCGVCEHVFNVHEDTNLVDVSSSEQLNENTVDETSNEQQKQNLENNKSTQDSNTLEAVDENSEITDKDNTESQEKLSSDDSQKDTYNFFEEEHNNETDYVVPREFRDTQETENPSKFSAALLGVGSALLITTLGLQYAWYNRNDFMHIPEVQAKIENLCQHFDCTSISFRDPSKIELVSRNIYSHPNAKEALMINLTIKNNATFSQPYPMMSIDFTDIRGDIVASRVFSPKEYLYAQASQQKEIQKILPPDSSSDIMMEMQDPGTKALTYEFNFL